MTPNERIATAILVWKSLFTRVGTGHQGYPDVYTEWAGEKAFEMARQAGCHKEYCELLLNNPVLHVSVKELEPWLKRARKERSKALNSNFGMHVGIRKKPKRKENKPECG